MNRAKKELIETLLVTAVIMAYIVLIVWIRSAKYFTPFLVLFCIVTIAVGVIAIAKSHRRR